VTVAAFHNPARGGSSEGSQDGALRSAHSSEGPFMGRKSFIGDDAHWVSETSLDSLRIGIDDKAALPAASIFSAGLWQ